MDRPAHHADFGRLHDSGIGFLNKLERGQRRKKRGFPSWVAFAVGDWERAALSLADERREDYAQELRRASHRGVRHRRSM